MIHIVFNTDDNYKEYCKVAMRSILAHTKEEVCFHVIGTKKFYFNANIKCYPAPDISSLTHVNKNGHITKTATYRLFAPEIIKEDKVIYLDCDLVVLDDIKKLWDIDVKYIAGVKDGLYLRNAKKNKLTHTYINSGVMVMNLKKLRKLDYIDRIKATQTGEYNLSLLDQDIINIIYEKELELLPDNWNIYATKYDENNQNRDNPSIIHWAGCDKPWNNREVWGRKKWLKYFTKKAIVLTYADITEKERKLLKDTTIFKIACNAHSADLKPNIRLCADDIVNKCLDCDTCDVISVDFNTDRNTDRVIRCKNLPRRYSTLLYCVDWLILQGYDNILLVANNLFQTNGKIKKDFQKLNRDGINSLKGCAYIYKYSLEGEFDVPTLSIKEFLEMEENTEFMPLTAEDKLLGRTEPRKKTVLEKMALSEAYRYEVCLEGRDNKSVVGGDVIDNLLSYEAKQRLMAGEEEIKHNGFVIRRLTNVVEKPVEEEVPKPVVKKKKTRTK